MLKAGNARMCGIWPRSTATSSRWMATPCASGTRGSGRSGEALPHNLTDAAKTIARVITNMRDRGFDQVDVTRHAEDAWMDQLTPNPVMTSFLSACTPGYYNNEGQ